MKDEGFAPARRIRRRRDYLDIQREGHKRHTRHFLVFVRRHGGDGGAAGNARLGITVTRKVGNAVTRNRIKRLLREVFRRDPLPWGLDVVWVAKRNAATVTYREVVEEFHGWAQQWARCEESTWSSAGA